MECLLSATEIPGGTGEFYRKARKVKDFFILFFIIAFDIESDIFRTVTFSTSNMLLSHDSVLRIVSEIKEMNTVFERPE